MAIIGASPDAVKAAIDAHKSGSSITNSQTFQTALSHVNSSNSQMFFADVQAIIEGVKTAIPSDESGMFSALVAPNLAPIKSVILTSTSDSNGQSAEMFIVIQ
jgi:hypothetical protein